MNYWNRFVHLSRQELYERVWSTPTSQLRHELGISDVAIGKLCRANGIPKPPPGYWARVRAGGRVRRPPLPALKQGQRERITYRKSPPPPPPLELPPAVAAKVQAEADPANRIEVGEELLRPHPLVRATRTALKGIKPDLYGLVRPRWGHGSLDVRVTPALVPRALRILDALVKALSRRGYKVEGGGEGDHNTWVKIGEQQVSFHLSERVRQVKRTLTEKEQSLPYWERPRANDYLPQGELKFVFGDGYSARTRTGWSDGKSGLLEGKLNWVVAGLIEQAEKQRQEAERRAEEHRRRQEEQQQREEAERRRGEEQERQKQLEALAAQWARACELRGLLSALVERWGEPEPNCPEAQFLHWAREHAVRLDPLKNGGLEALVRQVTSEEATLDWL